MDFFNDIFHNLALLEFYFLNIIYILLYIYFILSIFFQHSNILTRASHHWCLASNIVLVYFRSAFMNQSLFQMFVRVAFEPSQRVKITIHSCKRRDFTNAISRPLGLSLNKYTMNYHIRMMNIGQTAHPIWLNIFVLIWLRKISGYQASNIIFHHCA